MINADALYGGVVKSREIWWGWERVRVVEVRWSIGSIGSRGSRASNGVVG